MGAAAATKLESDVASARADRRELLAILSIAAQLALGVVVVREFQLESRTFYDLMMLLAGGFVVHALLPLRARQPFFVALSAAALAIAVGVVPAVTLAAVGLVILGVVHLPLSYRVRIALLLVIGLALALCRAGRLPGSWLSDAAWAVLGSMFMFRLALYVYALRSAAPDDPRPTVARTLAYFFMAPNVSFPLFPVVDYQTFARQYYDRPAGEIYQTGMRWVGRGLIQLVLYRLVYHDLVNNPGVAIDLGDVIQWVLSTYLLYLRVSGSFHVAVGLLGLFGWRLPETHHLYYLASSFNDFWRRINIYWKDFMMKLVYYPSFFRLRRLGNTVGLVGATAAVFLATWVLHSYQWFWLRGGWPITLPDILFWGILGAVVIWNALRETKRGRRRMVGKQPAWSWSLAWKTVGTFTFICVLWSLWSSESVGDWMILMSAAAHPTPRALLWLAGLLAGGLAISGRAWGARKLAPGADAAWYARPAFATAMPLVVAAAIGAPTVQPFLTHGAQTLVADARRTTLNANDEAQANKGYYEKLDVKGRLETAQWDPAGQAPADWADASTKYLQIRNAIPRRTNIPNVSAVQAGFPVTINEWGFRGRDYTLAKPAGVRRIAMLGASQTFGFGVGDSAVYSVKLEERLNRDHPFGPGATEVLNFGVVRGSVLDRLSQLESDVLKFDPDVVVITLNWREPVWVAADIAGLLDGDGSLRYPEMRAILQRDGVLADADGRFPVPSATLRGLLRHVGIHARMPWFERQIHLRQASEDVTAWALARMASDVRAHHAVPIVVGLDIVTDLPPQFPQALADARTAGMDVIDLFHMFDGRDLESLHIKPWDSHPNAAGHQLIADRLYSELTRRGEELGLVSPSRVGPTLAGAPR